MNGDFAESVFYSSIAAILFFLAVLLGVVIYGEITKPNCAVWSDLKTKHGFISTGKVTIPTTYQGRDCLAYEEK